MTETIGVFYKKKKIAVIGMDLDTGFSVFEFTDVYYSQGLDLAPLMMPSSHRSIYEFPELRHQTYKGLPGLIADSLPDRFGTTILNDWLLRNKRNNPITPIERLHFIGTRAMGALEFRPSAKFGEYIGNVDIFELTNIAQKVVNARSGVQVELGNNIDKNAMNTLLSVGTSAGGARPKAVVAFNKDFSKAVSGQVTVPDGFTHYLLKFDGVLENNTHEETFGDPLGYGAMEYVYHLMAKECHIDMQDCFLLDEGSRRHFITKRFDRDGNNKIHTQTLNAIAHIDYNIPNGGSYEQLFDVARKLRLSIDDAKQLYRRMVFNIVANNNDDHSKNFSFIYDENRWSLAPAYDLAYSYKPESIWVGQHWMSANGKRNELNRKDLISVGQSVTKLPEQFLNDAIDEVVFAVNEWEQLAIDNGVPNVLVKEVIDNQNLKAFGNEYFQLDCELKQGKGLEPTINNNEPDF
ncbi:MAG: type II toxin-antitoxin system HipA family toxin [Pseudomonadota bacterium]